MFRLQGRSTDNMSRSFPLPLYADRFRAFGVVDFKLRSKVARKVQSIVDFVRMVSSHYFYATHKRSLPQQCSAVTIACLYACRKLTRTSFESLLFIVSVASVNLKIACPEGKRVTFTAGREARPIVNGTPKHLAKNDMRKDVLAHC